MRRATKKEIEKRKLLVELAEDVKQLQNKYIEVGGPPGEGSLDILKECLIEQFPELGNRK